MADLPVGSGKPAGPRPSHCPSLLSQPPTVIFRVPLGGREAGGGGFILVRPDFDLHLVRILGLYGRGGTRELKVAKFMFHSWLAASM